MVIWFWGMSSNIVNFDSLQTRNVLKFIKTKINKKLCLLSVFQPVYEFLEFQLSETDRQHEEKRRKAPALYRKLSCYYCRAWIYEGLKSISCCVLDLDSSATDCNFQLSYVSLSKFLFNWKPKISLGTELTKLDIWSMSQWMRSKTPYMKHC